MLVVDSGTKTTVYRINHYLSQAKLAQVNLQSLSDLVSFGIPVSINQQNFASLINLLSYAIL